MVASISPSQLAEYRRRGEKLTLIDVRTPAEFGEVHVDFARNVPLDRLNAREIAGMACDGPVYFVCKSGNRSQKACEKMLAAGVDKVASVDGGTAACEAAGLPVIHGRKVMSLERQVRIAAGALVAIGAALAAFGADATWKAAGAGLAGFVGCGLVFAGITDTCGMAMLIARMPWNRACRSATTCCSRLLLAAVLAAGWAGTASAQHAPDSLDAVKAAVTGQTAVLVDVREADEWQKGHVAGAHLVPLSSLERGIDADHLARTIPKGTVIYTYCMVGGRSVASARFFRAMGYDVRPLRQGYPELIRSGFPAAAGT